MLWFPWAFKVSSVLLSTVLTEFRIRLSLLLILLFHVKTPVLTFWELLQLPLTFLLPFLLAQGSSREFPVCQNTNWSFYKMTAVCDIYIINLSVAREEVSWTTFQYYTDASNEVVQTNTSCYYHVSYVFTVNYIFNVSRS